MIFWTKRLNFTWSLVPKTCQQIIILLLDYLIRQCEFLTPMDSKSQALIWNKRMRDVSLLIKAPIYLRGLHRAIFLFGITQEVEGILNSNRSRRHSQMGSFHAFLVEIQMIT